MKIVIEDRTGILGTFTVPDVMVERILSHGYDVNFSFGGWDADKEHFCRGKVELEPLAIKEIDKTASQHNYRELLDYNTNIDREEHHGPMEIAIDKDDVVIREKKHEGGSHYITMDHVAFDKLCEIVDKYRKMVEIGDLAE